MSTCNIRITPSRMNGGGCLVVVAVDYTAGTPEDLACACESVRPQIAAQIKGDCTNGMAIVMGDVPKQLRDVVIAEIYPYCESVAVYRLVVIESRGNYPKDSVVPEWKISGVLEALQFQPA